MDARSRQIWLRRILPTTISIGKSTTPREIIDAVKRQHNVTVSYEAAKKAKKLLLEDDFLFQSQQFELLPAYTGAVLSADPSAHVQLSVEDREGTRPFKQLFVCPGASRESYRHCRQVLAMDGTPTNDTFELEILTATSIDAGNHVVLVAWAVVDRENEGAWRLFFANLQSAIPEANSPSTTIIVGDCDKGLRQAQDEMPLAIQALCLENLSRNLQKDYGLAARNVFDDSVLSACTEKKLQEGMEELQEVSPEAVTYLRSLDQSLWAEPYFPGRRYGHSTSKVAGITDGLIGEDKRLSVIDLLHALWFKNRGLRFRHHQEAMTYHPEAGPTEYAVGLLEKPKQLSSHQFIEFANLHRASVLADFGEW